MRSVKRPIAFLMLCLLAAAISACSAGLTPAPTPAAKRKPVVASPPASPTPLALGPTANDTSLKLATPITKPDDPALKLPSDGHQVVVVEATNGEGVWIRNAPAGDQMKVWPDGSPMLVIGEDQRADGRTWRHVQTVDGGSGWVAAEYLMTASPEVLALAAESLSELGVAPRANAARPAESQSRVAAERPTPSAIAQPITTATPATIARASTNPVSANAAPPQPPGPAIEFPTPIRGPAGATSIDAGPTTLAVAGAERGVPIQVGTRPRVGMEMVTVRVTVTNRDAAPFALYRGSFRLALSDRSRVEALAGGDAPIPYSATIEPGSELAGSLTFEVPSGTRVDGLIWAPERDQTYALDV